MLQSFLVYTITALLLYSLAKNLALRDAYKQRQYNRQVAFWCPEIIFSLLIFALVAGMRYNTGVDHLTYLRVYLSIQDTGYTSRETFEPGFIFITKLFADADLHYFFYFAFWAIIQLFFIYYALKDRKFLLPYVALNIMLGSYFLSWMNGIRQCIVICAFVFLIKYIVERNFIKYAIAILILSTIHKSAYILIPVYFLFIKDFTFANRKICLIILAICVLIGMTPTWSNIMTKTESFLAFLGYDSYAENIGQMSESSRQVAWGPSRIGIFLTDVLIIWFYPKMKEFFKGDKYLSAYFLLFLIGTFSYNLLVNTSHIFLRPIGYFTIFRLPLTAYLLYYLKQNRKNAMFIFLSLIVFTYIYFIIYKSSAMPTEGSEINLYHFYFETTNL